MEYAPLASLARLSPNVYSQGMPKTNTPADTALIYCRVSALDSQSDSTTSLEAQERTLRAAATAHGYDKVHVVIERHSASVRLPELARSLDALDAGAYAALIVCKIDRLSRSGAAVVLRIADRAAAHKWRLIVLDLSLDTATIVGRLVLTILAGVAEMESGRRKERMRDYHSERRAQGDLPGITYGTKTIATKKETALIVRGRAHGVSWVQLAADLTAASTSGRVWYPNSVRRTMATYERAAA